MTKLESMAILLAKLDEQPMEIKKMIHSLLTSEITTEAKEIAKEIRDNGKIKSDIPKRRTFRRTLRTRSELEQAENNIVAELKRVGGMTIPEIAKFGDTTYFCASNDITTLFKVNPHIQVNKEHFPYIYFYREE